MANIHEQATLTSKGQITLPKAIRQALGVSTGAKVAFELRDGEVVVTRADSAHEDPSIAAFLGLLAADISLGRHIGDIPEHLANAMLTSLESSRHKPEADETSARDVAALEIATLEIEGAVDI